MFRLVCGGHPENTENLPHTTLTHALELKPHIEEPVCSVGSSHVIHCPDLRPQIRHDFVLSSRKAVEEYWNTLEYCYSASDRKAALHAFPGCAVNEVYPVYFLCISVTTLNFHSLSVVMSMGSRMTPGLFHMQPYLAFLEEVVI